jgi:hypothetical protein
MVFPQFAYTKTPEERNFRGVINLEVSDVFWQKSLDRCHFLWGITVEKTYVKNKQMDLIQEHCSL